MNLPGTSLIAGTRGKTGGRSFKAVNPATGVALEPTFHEASEAEVARAMEAAAEAFVDYRARAGAQRAEFLERIATEIEALGDALIERATAETGLPAARITGERGRTCGQLRLFAQVVREGSWVDIQDTLDRLGDDGIDARVVDAKGRVQATSRGAGALDDRERAIEALRLSGELADGHIDAVRLQLREPFPAHEGIGIRHRGHDPAFALEAGHGRRDPVLLEDLGQHGVCGGELAVLARRADPKSQGGDLGLGKLALGRRTRGSGRSGRSGRRCCGRRG